MAKRKRKKAKRAARPRKKASVARRGVIRRSPARRRRARDDTKRGEWVAELVGTKKGRPFFQYLTKAGRAGSQNKARRFNSIAEVYAVLRQVKLQRPLYAGRAVKL